MPKKHKGVEATSSSGALGAIANSMIRISVLEDAPDCAIVFLPHSLRFRGCSSLSVALLFSFCCFSAFLSTAADRVACWVKHQTLLGREKKITWREDEKSSVSNLSMVVNDSDEVHPVDTVDG